jgi:hypothetical protein
MSLLQHAQALLERCADESVRTALAHHYLTRTPTGEISTDDVLEQLWSPGLGRLQPELAALVHCLTRRQAATAHGRHAETGDRITVTVVASESLVLIHDGHMAIAELSGKPPALALIEESPANAWAQGARLLGIPVTDVRIAAHDQRRGL